MRINEEYFDNGLSTDELIGSERKLTDNERYPIAFIFGTEIYPKSLNDDILWMRRRFNRMKSIISLQKNDYNVLDNTIYTDSYELIELAPDKFTKLFEPLNGALANYNFDYMCGYVVYMDRFKKLEELLKVIFYGKNLFERRRGNSFTVCNLEIKTHYHFWSDLFKNVLRDDDISLLYEIFKKYHLLDKWMTTFEFSSRVRKFYNQYIELLPFKN